MVGRIFLIVRTGKGIFEGRFIKKGDLSRSIRLIPYALHANSKSYTHLEPMFVRMFSEKYLLIPKTCTSFTTKLTTVIKVNPSLAHSWLIRSPKTYSFRLTIVNFKVYYLT